MIELIIPSLEVREPLNDGLNVITIKDVKMFRCLYADADESLLILNNGKDSKKEIIKNVLDIDINEKKNITTLHKEILRHIKLSEEDKYVSLLKTLAELIYDVQNELANSEIVVAEKIDEEKILQALNVSYKEHEDFLLELVTYIKEKSFNQNISIFLTFNLCMVLTADEIAELNKEMEKLSIVFIDVSSSFTNRQLQIKNIIIDEDWCII